MILNGFNFLLLLTQNIFKRQYSILCHALNIRDYSLINYTYFLINYTYKLLVNRELQIDQEILNAKRWAIKVKFTLKVRGNLYATFLRYDSTRKLALQSFYKNTILTTKNMKMLSKFLYLYFSLIYTILDYINLRTTLFSLF